MLLNTNRIGKSMFVTFKTELTLIGSLKVLVRQVPLRFVFVFAVVHHYFTITRLFLDSFNAVLF
jgi:hypothetical protein